MPNLFLRRLPALTIIPSTRIPQRARFAGAAR